MDDVPPTDRQTTMARIPMNAREQLELARAHGHELWIEHGTRVCCSCGYRSTTRRTRSALNATMAWHLGNAISEALDVVNGH